MPYHLSVSKITFIKIGEINVKLSKFIRISVVVCCLGLYATTVFSSSTNAKDWGNAFFNSDLLFGVRIHLGYGCITTKFGPKKVKARRKLKIVDFGASVAPLKLQLKETIVGVHIVPYVYVTSSQEKNQQLQLYLIPGVQELKKSPLSFREFYVACFKKYNQQLASSYLKYYPVVLLHVDKKSNRDMLLKELQKKLFWKGFLKSKITDVKSLYTVGDLLQKIFALKQAQFLNNLPFNVCVELINEKKQQNLKFAVKNVKGSLPFPCGRRVSPKTSPKPESSPKESHSQQTGKTGKRELKQSDKPRENTNQEPGNVKQFQAKIKELQEQIAQLKHEKSDVAKQIEMAVNSKLKELVKQLTNASNQQPESSSVKKLENEVEQLKRKFEETQTNPDNQNDFDKEQSEDANNNKTAEVKSLKIQLTALQKQLAQLITDEKLNTTKQFEAISSKLNVLTNKLAEIIHQQRKSSEDKKLDKEVKQLRQQLATVQAQQAQLATKPKQQPVSVTDSGVEIKHVPTKTGHRLIVVSLSGQAGKTIRESFQEVFSTKINSKTQFTLLTIQTGRQLYTLLSSDELPNLPAKGENSISVKLNKGISFGATGLRALDDLSLVDTFIQYQEGYPITSVLYLTDNTRMSDDPRDISRKQRGVPLAWHTDGIDLTVLTTNTCQVWEDVKAGCISWQNKTTLIRELKDFLQ